MRIRAALNRMVREFFHARAVLEVETPMLSAAGITDPNIEAFHLEFSGRTDGGPRRRWLRTSPEYAMKRLLAAGIGDCYELGRVFRDGEAGGRHNPEFTMLEWYRVGWDQRRLAEEVAELLQAALALVQRRADVHVTTYRQLFRDHLEIDPFVAPLEALQTPLAEILIEPVGLTRDDWLDLLITHRIQPTFPEHRITVLHDYPASQCALARLREDAGFTVAERFEVFLGPLELANGYHELRDAREQAERFHRDLQVREERGSAARPIDHHLLDALQHGLPSCAGVALGMDRLLMAMVKTSRIADVLAFDFTRA